MQLKNLIHGDTRKLESFPAFYTYKISHLSPKRKHLASNVTCQNHRIFRQFLLIIPNSGNKTQHYPLACAQEILCGR